MPRLWNAHIIAMKKGICSFIEIIYWDNYALNGLHECTDTYNVCVFYKYEYSVK